MVDLFGNDLYDGLRRTATFSPCGRYRYCLARSWDQGGDGRTVCFVMLNPSTASELIDDPTIRRCMRYAQRWGFSCLEIRNIFALRSTDPRELYKADDPVGPEGDKAILDAASADLVVVAWGEHGGYLGRANQVMELLREVDLYCLGVNQSGHPKHPLYVPARREPAIFRKKGGTQAAATR